MLAYEKEMISGGHQNYEHIVDRLTDIIEGLARREGNGDNPEVKSQKSEPSEAPNSEEAKNETDALLKFREHERERQREKKVK